MSDLVDRESSTEFVQRATAPEPRASDADRHATVMLIQDGVARGLLTPGEGSERMEAAYAAVHVRDLAPLTADLPPAITKPESPGWLTLLGMVVEKIRSFIVNQWQQHRRRTIVLLIVALVLLAAVALFGAHAFGGDGGGGFERDRLVPGGGGRIADLPGDGR